MGSTKDGADSVKARFDALKAKMKTMQPGFLQSFNRWPLANLLAKGGLVSDGPTHTYRHQIDAEKKAIEPLNGKYDGFHAGLDAAIAKVQPKAPYMKSSRDNGKSVLTMLSYNDDHFAQCAQITIRAVIDSWKGAGGGKPAAKIVDAAKGQERKVIRELLGPKLSAEHHLEAAIFSHFWTDQLAGGHVRTPRHALRQLCNSGIEGVVGGLMTNSMHNEDNMNGVPVTVALPLRDKVILVGDPFVQLGCLRMDYRPRKILSCSDKPSVSRVMPTIGQRATRIRTALLAIGDMWTRRW